MPEETQTFSPEDFASLKERAKKDFYFFAKAILGFDWLTPHIHLDVCRMLEDRTTNRAVIVLPRGWLKSTIGSIAWPIWEAINNPNIRILIVQNTITNAQKKLASIRAQFENNDLFRALFGDLIPNTRSKDAVWRSDALQLNRKKAHAEATFEVAGTRTTVTSRHYDIIIEDDTVAPDLDDLTQDNVIPSQDDIAQGIGWHRLAPPLLVDIKQSKIVVIGTRWFEEDLISFVLDNEKSYKSIQRACLEDDEGKASEKGRVTYPERFDEEVLQSLRDSMGPYLYSCLYLNKPVRSDDMLFKPSWFNYYVTEPSNLITYTSVDSAGDPEESHGNPDFNVVLTTGKDLSTGTIYVLDYFRERCNPSALIDAVFNQVRKWKPVKVRVETVAYQKTLLYWLKERMRADGLYFSVEGITHGRKSKNARIQGLQPIFAAGAIKFRKWMTELVSELLAFPLGKNDDLPDALAMQTDLWAQTVGEKKKKEDDLANNPLSLISAKREILSRATSRPPIYDLLDLPPHYRN